MRARLSKSKRFDFNKIFRKFGVLLVFVLMLGISSILDPDFFATGNLMNILKQVAVVAILASGETMLIIGGQIDLGAGSVLALGGTVAAAVYLATANVYLAILACIIVTSATGLVNGFLVTRFSLPSFIVTLAMMNVARGLALIVSGGVPLALNQFDSSSFKFLGQGKVFNTIPVAVFVMLFVYFVTWIILQKKPFGRYIYAIGGNEDAAKASGINVTRVKMLAFFVNGIFTGIAGFLLMSRINVGQPTAGVSFEFDAITAAILGGVSFSGGVGYIWNTLVGCLIIGILSNVLNLMNVTPYIQQIVKGVIIVLAVIMDQKTKQLNFKKS